MVAEDTVSQLRSCSNTRHGTAKSSDRGPERSHDLARVLRVAKKYRDAGARGSAGGFAADGEGRPGAVGICTQSAGLMWSRHRGHLIVRCGQVSPRFRGRGPDAAPSAGRGSWRPVVRRPGSAPRSWRCRAPRAFSSVGESARLITVRSLVRIQKGPRPPHPGRPLPAHGGRSSAGRAPALQAGGRRFEPGRLHSNDHSLPPSWRCQSTLTTRIEVCEAACEPLFFREGGACRRITLHNAEHNIDACLVWIFSRWTVTIEGQATKSMRRMPWHQEPKKDVALLR